MNKSTIIGQTAWNQIPLLTKMRIGAHKPTVNYDQNPEGWHLRFRCNLSDDGRFISLEDGPAQHTITVHLDGNDTYHVKRWRGPILQSECKGVYWEDFDTVLMTLSDRLPAGPDDRDSLEYAAFWANLTPIEQERHAKEYPHEAHA